MVTKGAPQDGDVFEYTVQGLVEANPEHSSGSVIRKASRPRLGLYKARSFSYGPEVYIMI
jgi:hypothetical protein